MEPEICKGLKQSLEMFLGILDFLVLGIKSVIRLLLMIVTRTAVFLVPEPLVAYSVDPQLSNVSNYEFLIA